MDVKFLESCCEAYIIENNLYETLTTEQMFKDVYKSLYYMREYHKDDSNIVENYDKVNQHLFLNEYFDLTYKQETINEIGVGTAVGAGILASIGVELLLKTIERPITKVVSKTFNNIGINLERLGNFLSKGRYWKFQYAIIQKNLKQSYIKCGIDPKKVNLDTYRAISDSFDKAEIKIDKQAKCMRDEYIELLIEKIALLLKSYFVCLKKTGNFNTVENIDPKEIMTIIGSTQLSNSCLDYHEIAKQTLNDFDYIIKTFINRSKHQNYYNLLMKKIGKAKKDVQFTKNLNKFK